MADRIAYTFQTFEFFDDVSQEGVARRIQQAIQEQGHSGHRYMGYLKYYDDIKSGEELGQLTCFMLIFEEADDAPS